MKCTCNVVDLNLAGHHNYPEWDQSLESRNINIFPKNAHKLSGLFL